MYTALGIFYPSCCVHISQGLWIEPFIKYLSLVIVCPFVSLSFELVSFPIVVLWLCDSLLSKIFFYWSRFWFGGPRIRPVSIDEKGTVIWTVRGLSSEFKTIFGQFCVSSATPWTWKRFQILHSSHEMHVARPAKAESLKLGNLQGNKCKGWRLTDAHGKALCRPPLRSRPWCCEQ